MMGGGVLIKICSKAVRSHLHFWWWWWWWWWWQWWRTLSHIDAQKSIYGIKCLWDFGCTPSSSTFSTKSSSWISSCTPITTNHHHHLQRRREDWSLSNSDPKCLHPPSWSCWATLTHLKQISKLKAERKLTTSNLRLEKKSSWRWNQALSAVVILTGRSLLRRLFAFESLANFSSLYNSLPLYTLYNSLLFYVLYNSLPFTKCNIQYYRMSKSSLCVFLFEIHPWNTGNGGLANFGTVKFLAPFHCKFFLC